MRASKRLRQRGFALYMGTLLLLMIIPMIGLAIDSTLLYVVKTRLQGAVDGAALHYRALKMPAGKCAPGAMLGQKLSACLPIFARR